MSRKRKRIMCPDCLGGGWVIIRQWVDERGVSHREINRTKCLSCDGKGHDGPDRSNQWGQFSMGVRIDTHKPGRGADGKFKNGGRGTASVSRGDSEAGRTPPKRAGLGARPVPK